MVRTFQITQPFAKISVRENIMVGAYFRTADRKLAEREAETVAGMVAWQASSTRWAPISPSPAASAWNSRVRSPPGRACCCSTR